MQRFASTLVLRAAVGMVCSAAVIATGCGTEVRGQSSMDRNEPYVEPAPQAPVSSGVTPPPVHAVVDYQIGGAYPPAPGTGVVTRDRAEDPVEGVYSICYINAFQAQPDESGFWEDRHPDLLLTTRDGRPVRDEEWDEPLLDISTADKRERLAAIVDGWMADCADRGFKAVEPDNLDSWTRSGGRLTRDHAVEYSRLLAQNAHARGMAIAQKNAAELTDAQIRLIGFDFAVAEECQQYSWGTGTECDRYRSVYGVRVIEIEYSDGGTAAFTAACRERGDQISVLLRDRDVVPRGADGYVNRSC
ncbi:endo alpha-1,4 polygalactosaminidase [Rhodococcus sp. IEGM 1408]|uniref:endo alpha-1,4 polygalactosaminidase n=1 Tax=Rhodococcus sp. IEGM 1408 TaxID=3082220 RepID=UPI0029554EFD|nr:endo alpha-1,4 polygalactosaminidase [Rhodococcus sp. IEGM 1408]MDV8000108.1 endo alpha-1,4 polygalactosaminidase [Rhodococcus sp. IEGM 1408]